MGWNDHVDFELHDTISDAVDEGYIEEGTSAFGVAQQVIHSGYDSLTDKQKWVYDNHVEPALKRLFKQREAEEQRARFERDD